VEGGGLAGMQLVGRPLNGLGAAGIGTSPADMIGSILKAIQGRPRESRPTFEGDCDAKQFLINRAPGGRSMPAKSGDGPMRKRPPDIY